MELTDRKYINNTGNLPEYAEGKLLHKPTLQGVDGMITGGINFLGLAVNSFGGVKSSNDILAEAGTSVGQGSGFQYQKLNPVDAGALMDEVSKLNTANTLNTAAAGASLGAAFGPIGAGIGGVVGGAVGFIGGLFRKNKMAERIKKAQLLQISNNNYALASALSDYLVNDYNLNHDNTLDDLLYHAKNGKLPGFVDGFDGRARISNGEIYGHIDRFGNVLDMHRAGQGKDNRDTLIRRLGNTPEEFDRAFVVTNKGGASDYVAATGDVAGGLEIGNIMKDFRAVKWLENGKFPKFDDGLLPYLIDDKTPNLGNAYKAEIPELPILRPGTLVPIGRTPLGLGVTQFDINRAMTTKLSNSIDINRNKYKPQKNNSEEVNNDSSNLYNVITSSAGILGGLSLILGAHNLKLNRPDIYAANPHELLALLIMASRRPNTNQKLAEMAHAEARNRYNLNRMGGLSGALKYLSNVASNIGLLRNIANVIGLDRELLNNYRGEYAKLASDLGSQIASRRMTANQYMDEAYARSHGARTQMELMGLQNILAAFELYYKNLDKLNRFNRTMAYYDQDYQLRKDALNRG